MSRGYWKTLIDRPMYNNDGTYRDQQIVNVSKFQKDMLTPAYTEKNWSGYAVVKEPSRQKAEAAADRFVSKKRNSLKGSDRLAEEMSRIMAEAEKTGTSGNELQAKIDDAVNLVWDELVTEYGSIKTGEKPARAISVPRKTEKGKKVSQTVRTILEAGATPDAAVPTIKELVDKGDFSYDVYTDKEAIADAEATIKSDGYAQALADWTKSVTKGEVNKANTALGWALYNKAANSGDLKTAMTILNLMVQHQRNAAQAVQATRILKKLSPDAQLYGIQRSVENLQKELKERYGKKAPKLQIDENLAEDFLNAKSETERNEARKKLYQDIGRQMPSRFIDKWNAWRYLSMLGNPRTHVRNIVGNAGFAPVVAAKNMTATAIEAIVSRVSGGKIGRTKGLVGFGKADIALLQAAWNDYANAQDELMAGGKYNDAAAANSDIESGRRIFKWKPLEAARKGNSAALEAEDMWFARPHYAYALAQYCKANGVTADQLQRGKALGQARAYAIKEAQKATYRDTNAFSKTIGSLGRYTGDNPVKKGISTVIEGILPFRKTPANILVRGVEYSPVGLLKSLAYDLPQVAKGNKTAAEAIDNISAGLTGTGLLTLGIFLAAQGLVRGAGGGDDDKNEFKELQGHQTYALELPNGKSVTIDWLAPECLPLFIGVNLWEQTAAENDALTMATMLEATANVTEPLLELSCLQSLNDVFDSVAYASSDGLSALPSVLASAATSYLTQGFPTLFGQIERVTEDTRNTTYTEKDAFLTGDMQYTLGNISGKLPFEYNQIPYIDAWGRKESTGNVGERAFNNLLNPAYTSEITTSAMEEELMRLYEATGERSVLPSRAAKYFTVDSERVDLTGEEYVKYATRKGQTAYDLTTKLTQSGQYKAMTNEQKVRAIEEVYDYANQTAKAAVSGYKVEAWVEKVQDAKKHGISPETYICLKTKTAGIESLKDKNGETIDNSKGLQIMQMVYNTTGLTEEQRKAMFEYLGVGKAIRHYNKSLVDQKLEKMRKKAK